MQRHNSVIQCIAIVLPLASVLFLTACGDKDEPGDTTPVPDTACTTQTGATVTYTTDIAPIMTQNCISCHGATIANADVRLHTCATAAANAQNALDEIDNGSMPPGGSIPDASRDKLAAWIAAGEPL